MQYKDYLLVTDIWRFELMAKILKMPQKIEQSKQIAVTLTIP